MSLLKPDAEEQSLLAAIQMFSPVYNDISLKVNDNSRINSSQASAISVMHNLQVQFDY